MSLAVWPVVGSDIGNVFSSKAGEDRRIDD